jgi:hypothetical protein
MSLEGNGWVTFLPVRDGSHRIRGAPSVSSPIEVLASVTDDTGVLVAASMSLSSWPAYKLAPIHTWWGHESAGRQTPAGKRPGNKWSAMLVEAAGSVGRMRGKNYLAAQHARLTRRRGMAGPR